MRQAIVTLQLGSTIFIENRKQEHPKCFGRSGERHEEAIRSIEEISVNSNVIFFFFCFRHSAYKAHHFKVLVSIH